MGQKRAKSKSDSESDNALRKNVSHNNEETRLDRIKKKFKQNLEKRHICLVGFIVTAISILVVIILQVEGKFISTRFGQVFNDVAIAGIPIGFISILFSYFDKLSYAKEQISSALYENEGYLLYDEKTQIEIKNKIEQNLHLKDVHDPKSLYSVVQAEISNIVQDTYIYEYSTTIDCRIVNGVFIKKFHEYIVYKNPNLKNKKQKKIFTEELLSTRVFKYVENNCGSNFTTGGHCKGCKSSCLCDVELWINGEKKKVNIEKSLEKDNNTLLPQYSSVYRFSMEEDYIKIGEDPVPVVIKFTTIVPVEDNIYVHKLRRATKNYTLDFRFNPEEMDIIPVSFGFMDDENIGNRVFIQHSDMGKQIRFRNWVLPGDGVIIVINKKDGNNANNAINDNTATNYNEEVASTNISGYSSAYKAEVAATDVDTNKIKDR